MRKYVHTVVHIVYDNCNLSDMCDVVELRGDHIVLLETRPTPLGVSATKPCLSVCALESFSFSSERDPQPLVDRTVVWHD